ncbi:MAG: hypothetical protein WC107_01235 [Patescibacteria group bacterium]
MENSTKYKGSRKSLTKAISILMLFLMLPFATFFAIAFSPSKTVEAAGANWQVKSVDTQIISKCWNNVPQNSIDQQVQMLKGLGVNYIAIGTPYDRPEEMEKWTTSIHDAGLNVWFRSHWLNWEGDEGQPKNMTPDQYVIKTKQFIIDHPSFFKSGDSFTMSVEAENAGVNPGAFADWNAYNRFLVQEIDESNAAFNQIGLGGQIKTNWLSMNGWIIENALTQATVDKMGLITPDHYSPQGDPSNPTPVAKLASDMSGDLDRFYAKWQKPIMIGEWGYHIGGEVSNDLQKQATEAVYYVFASKSYIMGVSYWDHMGNQTRIINDNSGTPTTMRPAADVIKSYYSGSIAPAPTPTPAPTPAPIGTKIISDFENGLNGWDAGSIIAGNNSGGALRISNPADGSNGAKKNISNISLSGYDKVEMDINLNGNKILPGDASALYFDQGGWKYVSLANYVQNGQSGWQHISVPISDFKLNGTEAAFLGVRFWNINAGNYDIDNVSLGSANLATTPPTGETDPAASSILANFESGMNGFVGGRLTEGNNSNYSLEISNPINGSNGSKKDLNDAKIGNYNYIELDINLKGNKILPGDASALYFDQGGWKWVSLEKYVKNGLNGWQHVSIPLSDFAGLNKQSGLASIGFRFWNDHAASYNIDNITYVLK